MTDEEANDLTYAEALQAAQPRIAEARASLTALSDQAQAYIRDAAAALRAWMARMAPLFARMWQRIVAWVQAQGILSPAYAYASPAMRRRAARERAHLAMRAKNRRI